MATKSTASATRVPTLAPLREIIDALTPAELDRAFHEPLAYPGAGVPVSSMLIGTQLRPMPHSAFCEVLALLGAAPMAVRTPVLAVKSNGSAGQVLEKFGTSGTVIPVLPVTVAGLRQGFAACVNGRGYVPFAPVADPEARTLLRLIWLDPDQLRIADETEAAFTRVHYASGSGSVNAQLYRSRGKVLRAPGGVAPLGVSSQAALFAALLEQPWFAEIVARWVWTDMEPSAGLISAALAGFEEMRTAVRQGFVDNELVCDDAL